MVALKGHFDGKVIVPDEPVDLPKNRPLLVHVEEATPQPSGDQPSARRVGGSAQGEIWTADNFDEPLDDFADYK